MRIVEHRSTLLAIIAALAPWAHLYVHAEGGWSDSTEEWTFPDPTPTSLSLSSPEPTTTSSYLPVSSTRPPGIRTLRGPPGAPPSLPTPPAAPSIAAPALPTAPFSPQPPPLYSAPAPHPLLAWVDYYDSSRTFLGEATTGSGDCHTIPIPDWGIIHITPTTSSESVNQLILYNDPNCSSGSVNREPASRTPPTIVRAYFKNVPQSMKWIRPLVSAPNAKLPVTGLSSSTTTLKSATSETATTPTTPIITTTSTQQPTPIRTTFPTSLIPPKPWGSGGYKGDRCHNDDDGDDDGRCGSSPVNKVLIVGITIAVLVVGLMMAGTYYIYKTFYSPPESSIYESFTVGSKYGLNNNISNGDSNGNSNSNSNINNPTSSRGTLDAEASAGLGQSYRYVHEEDENSTPRFMFDHSHDNINTNRDPKKFKESSAPSPSSSSQREWLW